MNRPTPLPPTGIEAPDGRRFPWGPIQQIHTVGDFAIVEFLDDRSKFDAEDSWAGHGDTMFHPYIDGRDTSRSYGSLESALVGAIAYRRRGPNSQAAEHFELMTLGGIPEAERGALR